MRIIDRKNRLYIFLVVVLVSGLFFYILPAGTETAGAGKVVIFIIDTGINTNNPSAAAGNRGHGSLVTRIIEHEVPAEVDIVPVDITGKTGPDRELYLAGLRRVINYKLTHSDRKVLVNISLGFPEPENPGIFRRLAELGVTVVAAAGNDNSEKPVFPAGYEGVIAVAGARSEGKTDFSNYGGYIDIAAPGNLEYNERIYLPGHSLRREYSYHGTSFAAPRVTALLAALVYRAADLTADGALAEVKRTALPIDDELYRSGKLGSGLLNKRGAMSGSVRGYRRKKIAGIISLAAVCLLFLLLLWQKYGVFSLFVFILLVVITLPVFLLAKEFITRDYIAGISGLLSLTVLFLFTGWKPWVIIFTFLITFFIPGDYPGPLMAALILITGEKLLLLLPAGSSDYRLLFRLLVIPSGVIKQRLEKKLKGGFSGRDFNRYGLKILISTGNRERKRAIIRILTGVEDPPLEALLYYAEKNSGTRDYICQQIASRDTLDGEESLLNRLSGYLRGYNEEYSKMAERILSQLEADTVFPLLKRLLAGDSGAVNKKAVLRIIAAFGTAAGSFKKQVQGMLEGSSDMWVRYQAVRTLMAISDRPGETISYLTGFIDDEQEPVRLEVRGLLEDYSQPGI